MNKVNPDELKTIANSDFSQFYQKHIILSPIYFSQNQDESYTPSFFILIEKGFYVQYYIHDWLTTEYLTSPEYSNSPYTDMYLIEGGRCSTNILPTRAIERIMNNGFYLCDTLEEIPEGLQTLYLEFYQKEFNSDPNYNLTFDMFNWLSIIKQRYKQELDIILNKKKTLIEYQKLSTLLSLKKNDLNDKVIKI